MEGEVRKLFFDIAKASGRSFAVSEEVWAALSEVYRDEIKKGSHSKSDIHVRIRDHFAGVESLLGFSIKSQLGSPSTLLNASQQTNFCYEVVGDERVVAEIAAEDLKGKKLVRRLLEAGVVLRYLPDDRMCFYRNLQLLDGDLPMIVAETLPLYYGGCESKLSSLVSVLDEKNPLGYPLHGGVSFYALKWKRLLREVALGMMPASEWSGEYDATGGYIIVKESGDLVAYHLLRRDLFEEYLLRHTKLETASTTRYGYGRLEEENGRYVVRLNLQVRFLR